LRRLSFVRVCRPSIATPVDQKLAFVCAIMLLERTYHTFVTVVALTLVMVALVPISTSQEDQKKRAE
jgi:hypothetical protein